uniref:Uncharacterized protein n=1 Tax=Steinernema glaseri TaxID=37863 RepID=A0A1I7Z995_9BILA
MSPAPLLSLLSASPAPYHLPPPKGPRVSHIHHSLFQPCSIITIISPPAPTVLTQVHRRAQSLILPRPAPSGLPLDDAALSRCAAVLDVMESLQGPELLPDDPILRALPAGVVLCVFSLISSFHLDYDAETETTLINMQLMDS